MHVQRQLINSRYDPCLVEGRHSNLHLAPRRHTTAGLSHACRSHRSSQSSSTSFLPRASEASTQASTAAEAQPSPAPPGPPADAEALSSSNFDHRGAVRVAATAALVYTLIGSRVPNAHALVVDEDREWRPRRHHRRLDERVSNSWAADAIEVGGWGASCCAS